MKFSFFIFFVGLAIAGIEVQFVYDGDTIKVIDEREKKIRLINIDAPESKQFYGDSSTLYLRKFLKGKSIDLQIVNSDQYGRELAIVFADGEDVNYHLVRNGYAWAYQYCKDESIIAAMGMAKKEKKGLWKYPDAISPYYFRKMAKN